MRERVAEFEDAQEIIHILRADGRGVIRAFLYNLASDLTADVPDLAFKIAHAGFRV